VLSVCGQLTAGKKNRLTKGLEKKKNLAENKHEVLFIIGHQNNLTGIDG